MAKENNDQETPEPTPDDIGPGAALDELTRRETGVHPGEVAPGQAHAAPASETMEIEEGHEPSEHSYWPVVVAAGTLLVGVGFLFHWLVSVVGVVVVMTALAGWFTESWVS